MGNKYTAVFLNALGLLIGLQGTVAGQSIKVAVASNLLLPFQSLEQKFEAKYPYDIEIISGASGTLTSQIANGAPYQVLVSADDKYISEVVESGRAQGGPLVLCFGSVYLWVKEGVPGQDPEELLQNDDIKSIGLAHPDLAPYGKMARDWLELKQLGIKVQDKIVFGNSIGQVNQYILTGSVDAAFTSNSVKFSKKKLEGRFFKIDEIWMDPVPQTMLILKGDGPGLFVAMLLKDFLLGKEARQVFEEFGYETPMAE